MTNQTIDQIVTSKLCLSCGACDTICNHNAISFQETTGGHLYPVINKKACTNCELCFKVCPGKEFIANKHQPYNSNIFKGNIISCMVGKSTSEEIFKNSQSGGAVTAVLKYLFQSKQIQHAIVAGMNNESPPRGKPLLINSTEQLHAAQKSKYTPIPILSSLKDIKNTDKPVAIVGLPCHIHGLLNLQSLMPALQKLEFIKLGLICERIMTTSAIDYLCHKSNLKSPTNVIFKDKQYGYPGDIVISEHNNKSCVIDRSCRKYIKDFFTPACCRVCFDKLNTCSDITFGDPHGIKGIDKKNGESLAIIRTQNGEHIINQAIRNNALSVRSIDQEHAIRGQRIDRKENEWNKSMSAWEAKGLDLPNFGFMHIESNKINIQKRLIELSLKLDKYSSSEKLFSAAKNFEIKQRLLKKKPIKNIYRLLNKLNKS